jgi:bifunctional non-homologous end joining protein LigD
LSLERYRKKRRFSRTPEPTGKVEDRQAESGSRLIYVIHKHHARNLHYDLRLEWGGVLKSWAVPKGPSLDPANRRLAVEVEDHPLDYADFEGVIPEGEYGAGQVIVWDRGHYLLEPPGGDFHAMISQGRAKIRIEGVKVKGGYMLVRTGRGGNRNNWLLIKEKDEEARPGYDVTLEKPLSVISGKDVADLS